MANVNKTHVSFKNNCKSRKLLRKKLIMKFLKENPGKGNKELTSRYIYHVEKFDNYEIILTRPAGLNNGFDFVIHTIGIKYKKKKTYDYPSHSDIIYAITQIFQNYPNERNMFKQIISNIYFCKSIRLKTLKNIYYFDFNGNAHAAEIIFLALKWLFIEQDVTYWNNSGRAKFFNELKIRGLTL